MMNNLRLHETLAASHAAFFWSYRIEKLRAFSVLRMTFDKNVSPSSEKTA
ncbi:hypothetical protein H7C19_33665 [Cohnella nanjingensis]|uniref:Uncharacterized protein n=1 Tax=Cohnella nanjingensis TaxID=1387779 RepID=A0A7X0RXR6_9BACL|nr:hypothetical protein [Cohnella nanjingensis]